MVWYIYSKVQLAKTFVSIAHLPGADPGVELHDSEQFHEVSWFCKKASEVCKAFSKAGGWCEWPLWPVLKCCLGLATAH